MDVNERIFEAISRIERHEAMCEERSKTIFNRLDNIEEGLAQIHQTLFHIAIGAVAELFGVVVSLLFLLK